METQTKAELFEQLCSRLDKVAETFSTTSFSSMKEKRQYPTKRIPILDSLQTLITIEDKPFYLCESALGIPIITEICDIILFTTRNTLGQLRVKPSMNVMCPDDGTCSLYDKVKHEVRGLCKGNRMGTLVDYFNYMGRRAEFDEATCGLVMQNPYVTDLLRILSVNEIPSKSEWESFLSRWPNKKCTCRLMERAYFHRGEIRAFVSDKDRLRGLLGATLHSLLFSRDYDFNQLPPFCDTAPRNKHLIFIEMDHSSEDELTLLFGDISSFTASLKNAWIVLITTIKYLEDNEVDEYIVVDIGGSLLECPLMEVLRMFLYLGSAVEVDHEGESFVSQGGMLGISGIDDLFKLFFSLFLRVLCKRQRLVTLIEPQVGGDDFFIRLLSKRNNPLSRLAAINFISTEVSKYIGRIKSLIVVPVAASSDFVTDEPFCKKQIRVVSEIVERRVHVKLQSQWPIPLIRDLIAEDGGSVEAEKFWESCKSVPYVPEQEVIQSVLYSLYSLRNSGNLSGVRITKVIDSVEHTDLITNRARKLLEKISPMVDSYDNVYKFHLRDKLSSVPCDRLVQVQVQKEGASERIIGCPGDFITRLEYTNKVLPNRNEEPDRAVEASIANVLEQLFGV